LAVLFAALFMAGCLVLVSTAATDAARPALAMSVVLLTIAVMVWRRAEISHAILLERRTQLENELDRRSECRPCRAQT
jgi:uncharacterized membrane protein YqjE